VVKKGDYPDASLVFASSATAFVFAPASFVPHAQSPVQLQMLLTLK
jgi:hypothetical protein